MSNPLLPGNDPGVINENVKTLLGQGYTHKEALAQAFKFASVPVPGAGAPEPPAEGVLPPASSFSFSPDFQR